MCHGVLTSKPAWLCVCLTCPSTNGMGGLTLPCLLFISQLISILLRQLRQLRQALYFRAFPRGWAGSAGGTAETDVTPRRPLRAHYRPKRLFTSRCQFGAVGMSYPQGRPLLLPAPAESRRRGPNMSVQALPKTSGPTGR